MDFPLPDSPPTLRERVAILDLCKRNADFREAVIQKCQEDTAWFVSCMCWTLNPKIKDPRERNLPFILPGRFEYQIPFFEWLDECYRDGKVGIVEKTREMGASWVILAWFLHKWLFEDEFQGLLGTRKEDLVDNRMPSSSFGKIDHMIRQLPGWLVPRGFNPDKHRMKLKLINPQNGAVIEGDSTQEDFSRQGRYSAIFLDEAASVPNLDQVMEAMSASSDCKFLVSTPKGMNTFYRLVKSGLPRVYRLHWSLDPEKDEEWYEAQREILITDEAMAQELDISYTKSAEGVVYPYIQQVPLGYYPYEDEWNLYCSWDFGIADPTAMVWFQRDPKTGKERIIDTFEKKGQPVEFFVPFALGYIPVDLRGKYDYTPAERLLIAEHSGWQPAIHYGDPAGNQRSQGTGLSVFDILRQHGIMIISNSKKNDYATRKRMTDMGLRNLEGINEDRCSRLIESLLNAQFVVRSPDSRSTKPVTEPVHDWTSHFRSAVEYYYVNVPPFRKRPRPEAVVQEMAYDRFTA